MSTTGNHRSRASEKMKIIKDSTNKEYLPYTLLRDEAGYFFIKTKDGELMLDEDEAIDLANAILDEFDDE